MDNPLYNNSVDILFNNQSEVDVLLRLMDDNQLVFTNQLLDKLCKEEVYQMLNFPLSCGGIRYLQLQILSEYHRRRGWAIKVEYGKGVVCLLSETSFPQSTFQKISEVEEAMKMKKGDVIKQGEIEADVIWVIDGAVAIKQKDGIHRIFELKDEPNWIVIKEGVPTYQSSVENLSDEELRKAIDDLRAQRTYITAKPRKVGTKAEPIDKNDPMAQALAELTPEKKQELMKKLGLVD